MELNPDSMRAFGEDDFVDVPMRSWRRDTINEMGAMFAAIQPMQEETPVGGEPKLRSWSDPKLAELIGAPFRLTAENRKQSARVLTGGWGSGIVGYHA